MEFMKCIACRSCINLNTERKCSEGRMAGADKPDECWYYHNKTQHRGLATHSEVRSESRISR